MKIKHIYTNNVGPLDPDWSVNLTDTWTGTTHEYILLSGPNGSGKSLILQMIANLWKLAGELLDGLTLQQSQCQPWFDHWVSFGGCAIVIENLFENSPDLVGILYGDKHFLSALQNKFPHVIWIARTPFEVLPSGFALQDLITCDLLPDDADWLDQWRESRKHLILTPMDANIPNIIHLDAEERRWLAPKHEVGQLVPDDFRVRWLTTYQATDSWKGSLESTLVNLKIVDQKKFEQVIRHINSFLDNKSIDPAIHPRDQNRLRVKLNHPDGRWHYLNDLSAGERQVLIILFTVSRWMESGGVVLIDEPDNFLHPSLIRSLVAHLERIVHERQGQLLITSHVPYVWERYETFGMRIQLGGNQG